MAQKALDFDGVDDYVNCGSGASLDDITVKTIEAWIKLESWGEWSAGRIIQKANVNDNGWNFLVDGIAEHEYLLFSQDFSTAAGWWETPAYSIVLNQWHYVVVVYDRSSDANDPIIYIDGVSQTVIERTPPSGTATSDAGQDLWIGARNNGGTPDREFDGIIDEVRISDKARTADEISAIWNGGLGKQFEIDGDTVALWHMNEGEGSTIYDETTNNNDGAITGASWVDGYNFVTPKTSAEAGQGAEALLNRAYILPETGAGLDVLGSRLLGAIEEGGGVEALLARLMVTTETASGLDAGWLLFTSTDVGSGLDAILALEALLTGADSGSGIDTAYLIKILLSTDSGLGTEAVAALLATIVTGELMVGSDRLVVKIESAPKGGGMRLPPGGKTSIPSRRVNL